MFIGVTPTILRPSLLSAILKPQDVVGIDLIQGTGGSNKVTNGINLAQRGGLVIRKRRDTSDSWIWGDTKRGAGNSLSSNNTNAESSSGPGVISFNTDGYTHSGTADTAASFLGMSIAIAPKVLDIVTWTGDGTSNRQIPHGLGVVPGMVIVRRRDAGGGWGVYHRSLPNPATDFLVLQQTGGKLTDASLFGALATATTFTVGSDGTGNAPGSQNVAYLFAHDPSADGIVQCGVSTADGSGTFVIPHGWANGAQWFIYKNIDAGSTDWQILDTARGSTNFLGGDPNLRANLPAAEPPSPGNFVTASQGALTVNDGGVNNRFMWAIIRAPY